MSQLSHDGGKVLRFQHERIVKNLFKRFLVMLEDLGRDHDAALGKLHDALPEQYKPFVDLADYLDEAKAEILRSKVLGAGNDALRELGSVTDQFEISLRS